MSTPIKERVRAHRQSLQSIGLKRVELIVPAELEGSIRKYAAKLRQKAKKPQKALLSEMRSLVSQAYEKYRSSCLDNIHVDPARAGLAEARVVAAALMKRGGSDAFVLGRRLAKLAA